MGDVVFAAPLAWDEYNKEFLYYTDAIAEHPGLEIWRTRIVSNSEKPTDKMCADSCCGEYGCWYDSSCPQYNYYSSYYYCCFTPSDCEREGSIDRGKDCCTSQPCPYPILKSVDGTVDVLLASDTPDRWIKLASGIKIKEQWANTDNNSGYYLPIVIWSTKNINSEPARVREAFKATGCMMRAFDPKEKAFTCETVIGAKKTHITDFVKEEQAKRYESGKISNDVIGVTYGLSFVVHGDVVYTYEDLCDAPLDGPATEISIPYFRLTNDKERAAIEKEETCSYNYIAAPPNTPPPDPPCKCYEKNYPDMPPLIGATGKCSAYASKWDEPKNFKERALWNIALSAPQHNDLQMVSTGATYPSRATFTNPWDGTSINVQEEWYEFRPYTGP